jgi:hypothetical protein
MHSSIQNKPGTIQGVLSGIRSIATKTGRAFALCNIGKQKCKCFSDLANHLLANQEKYENQGLEAYGYWEARRENEFIIEGFGKRPVDPTSAVFTKPGSATRPEKPAMEVMRNYIVITIPVGATREQVNRITDIANQALHDVGPGVFDFASAQVENIHPKDRIQLEDVPF